jgi:tetratricopeptide (TPR) repeat protein
MPQSQFKLLLASLILSATAFAGEAEDIAGLLNKGRADDALQAADKALSQSPSDARLRLLRGNALASLGRSAEAIQVYSALTVEFPTLPEPYNNLAAVYAQQGQLDKARAALQRALQTNPAYATAHANLSDIYSKLAAQEYEKALERDVVERHQNNNAAPAPLTSPAPTRLALLQDLVSRNPAASKSAVSTAPLVVASLPRTPIATPTPTPKPQPTPSPAPTRTPTPTPTPIVVAEVKPLQVATAKPVESKPVTTASTVAKPVDSVKEANEQVSKVVAGWADAWSNKRVSVYLSYYGHSFKPAGKSRSAWETERRERIEAAHKIEVKLANIKTKIDGDHASVHFVQYYRSDRLDTSTGKTLILEKTAGRWLISEERVG